MLTIGTQNSDRITTITDTTWAEYITLNLPTKLVSYRNGAITIVSPGRNHEQIADYIRSIIWTYCRKNNLPLFSYNQTTLREEGREAKEPDVAYCFREDKDKPDLAVEVNLTSGSIDDLTKYEYLKIAEVWVWEQNKVRFFAYRSQGYTESTTSSCLPYLKCDRVTQVVNSCFGKSILEVEKAIDADI